MRALPTGTVTLLFTAIEGSTRLLQQFGERYAGLLEACRFLVFSALPMTAFSRETCRRVVRMQPDP